MPSSRYEVGDEVDLRVRIVRKNGVGATVVVVGCPLRKFTFVLFEELDAGKRVPRPMARV